MRVLVACEWSGVVRKAFRAKGHEAISCDFLHTPGNSPYHIRGDVLDIIDGGWDLMIAFPPCTDLASSGSRWFKDKVEKQIEALKFVRQLLDAPIEHICIENPVGVITKNIRKWDQLIQPYDFGEDASKQTCLWLKNLPKLQRTEYVHPRLIEENGKVYKRWANQTDSGQNKLGPSKDRAKIRGITYEGIAKAMAEQWSNI
jgi:site-specific DNA-cytosine methylase